jgi:hypothetical protein
VDLLGPRRSAREARGDRILRIILLTIFLEILRILTHYGREYLL